MTSDANVSTQELVTLHVCERNKSGECRIQINIEINSSCNQKFKIENKAWHSGEKSNKIRLDYTRKKRAAISPVAVASDAMAQQAEEPGLLP